MNEPVTVDPSYVIAAQGQELARVNDNRVLLLAYIEQLTARVAELEAELAALQNDPEP